MLLKCLKNTLTSKYLDVTGDLLLRMLPGSDCFLNLKVLACSNCKLVFFYDLVDSLLILHLKFKHYFFLLVVQTHFWLSSRLNCQQRIVVPYQGNCREGLRLQGPIQKHQRGYSKLFVRQRLSRETERSAKFPETITNIQSIYNFKFEGFDLIFMTVHDMRLISWHGWRWNYLKWADLAFGWRRFLDLGCCFSVRSSNNRSIFFATIL